MRMNASNTIARERLNNAFVSFRSRVSKFQGSRGRGKSEERAYSMMALGYSR